MLERELTHHIINSAPLPAQHKTSFITTLSFFFSSLLEEFQAAQRSCLSLAQPGAVLWEHSGLMEGSPHAQGQGRDGFQLLTLK